MARIISKPIIREYENWKAVVRCVEQKIVSHRDLTPCGAKVEITEEDLILLYYKGEFGGQHYYPGWKCPNCSKINSVGRSSKKKFPHPVWKRLLKRSDGVWDGWQEREG